MLSGIDVNLKKDLMEEEIWFIGEILISINYIYALNNVVILDSVCR